MLFTRRMAREAATPLAARIVAARPAARSIAFVARPAAAVIARRVGVLAVAGTAASVTSGGAVLAESKGWPGTRLVTIIRSTGTLELMRARARRDCTAGIEELQNDPAGVLQELAQEAGPVVSVGMVSGFASGFALKKAGKVAAVVRSHLRTFEQAPSEHP